MISYWLAPFFHESELDPCLAAQVGLHARPQRNQEINAMVAAIAGEQYCSTTVPVMSLCWPVLEDSGVY